MGVFNELEARGMIAQMTHPERIRELLDKDRVTFYVGFDPTADSLHVGHFVQIMVMSHLQKAGHRPIALLGGGTAMVGDPSGKSDMRRMMTAEEIMHNADCFRKQMSKLIDFSDDKALIVNNADWLMKLNYIEFLREVGVHFSVNRMLAAECYKQRLEHGLSFFEMNYMIMQSYDFLVLNRKYGCTLQMGGDDQWSNIIAGADLIRRMEQREAFGMTFALLLTSDGRKMGKTEKGAVWLDPAKTSPYDFYQYWRNIDDADVIKCMKMLTFMDLKEIAEYEKLTGSELNRAKERLAFEVTALIHGNEAAENARETARALFGKGAADDRMPTAAFPRSGFADGSVGILELMTTVGLTASNGEARRLIQQGGITLDDRRVADPAARLTLDDFAKGHVILRKGKKTYLKVTLS